MHAQLIQDNIFPQVNTKLTKKQRRLLRKQGFTINNGLQLKEIKPLTENQRLIFKNYYDNNLLIFGSAGTGKTFIATYLALNDILNNQAYDKLMIFRSAVPTRKIGFLPGNEKEKTKVYEMPYIKICSNLFNRDDAYQILKQKGQIEFDSTSFQRGMTYDDTIILLEEIQNFSWQEIKTILTRVGNNCKVIVCGDIKQPDLSDREGKGDVEKLVEVCYRMNTFFCIEMQPADIVRSGFVKQFITTCEKLNCY